MSIGNRIKMGVANAGSHGTSFGLLAACALLCTACVTPPRIEDYAATMPSPDLEKPATNGAIYQQYHEVGLFNNATAHSVGDLVTIHLVEQTTASKSASTTTSKASKAVLPSPTLLGKPVTINGTEILSAGMNNNSSFDGEGGSKQSNSLAGDITVTVARRLANGNLLVRGQKWIEINQGMEYVRIQGIIRPIDLAPDNSVPSNKVADATISYGGKGTLADSNTKGWLARFFDSPLLPF